MNCILIISDDEILSQLYMTNLEVYLDAKIIVSESVDSALVNLEKEKSIELIITLATLEEIQVVESLQGFFKENKKNIPIIALDESNLNDKNVIEIKSYYSIQNIIRTSAKTLGVTAKAMASKVMPNYYPIDINFFKSIKKAPANLYIEVNRSSSDAEFVVFGRKDTNVEKIIEKFKAEGVEKIYVHPNDRLHVVNFISLSICEVLSMNQLIDKSEKSEILASSMDFVAKTMDNEEVSNEIIALVNTCSKVMAAVVNDSPDLNSLLKIFLRNKNGFAYSHSMLSAYVAAHIVKNVPWGGESHIEKINFVLFFHDVPLAPIFEKNPDIISEEDLLFSPNVTNDEKNIVLNHARISAELVSGLKRCPIGADLLIKQHHGMGNGIGFAIDFRDDISPLSKIVIVAEAFVEELLKMKSDKKEKISVNEIILKLKTKFQKHTYKKIVDTLATIKI